MSAGAVCVAVVEDDLALGQLIVDVLEGAQLSARWFKRGQDFLRACLGPQAFAAALLDMRLPDMTGLRVLQSMPTESSPPVMMLTGMTEESGLVAAFELGVHDYLFKPFRPAELIARLQGLIRRTAAASRMSSEALAFRDSRGAVLLGELLDASGQHRESGQPGSDTVALTEKERACAQVLLDHLGQTVSREDLRQRVWRGHQAVTSRSIDTHVSRVRTKLGLVPSAGFELASVYGVGYRLQKLA